MTREEVYKFIETVTKIQASGGTLSQYFDREIADAIPLASGYKSHRFNWL